MACVMLFADFRTKCSVTGVTFVLCIVNSCVAIQLNGFRVESLQSKNLVTTDALGRVNVVGSRSIMLRLFTLTPLPPTSEISFATVSAQYRSDCTDLRSTSIFVVEASVRGAAGSESYSGTVEVRLPTDPAVYMFCVRARRNTTWRHQGNSSWLQLVVAEPLSDANVAPSVLPFWAQIFLVIVCVVVAAECTALAVSVLSLTRTELKVLRGVGSCDERSYAKAVSPLRKRGNRILCAIVFFSVISCATICVLMEDMIQLTGAALAVSSALILVFVVILPLLICSHLKLVCLKNTMWLVKVAVVMSFPFSYPMGRLMDWLLADDLPSVCDRSRILSLQRTNHPNSAVKEVEEELADYTGGLGSSILGLSDKSCKDLMTAIDDVFMVEYNVVLDEKCLELIASSGYTRIPVYEKERTNIVALLHVCDLAYVSSADSTSLRTLCKFYNHPVNFVFEDTKLEVLLAEFKKGQSRMAFVQRVNNEGPGDPFYETLGMITFEDVIADIFQSEVASEPPDIIVDSNEEVKNLNKVNKNNFARLPRTKKELTEQMSTAVCQFLATSVMQFSRMMMSEKVIRRLLKQDVIVNNSFSEPDCKRTLYERGKPADYFVLIVEGHVQIHIGAEEFVFDGGPFMHFGAQALTDAMVTNGWSRDTPPAEGTSDVRCTHVYIPDYTVEAVTDLIFLRVTVEQYAAALNAASLERHLRAAESHVDGGLSDGCVSQCGDSPAATGDFQGSSEAPSPLVEPTSRSQLLDGGHTDNTRCRNMVDGQTRSCNA